MIVDKAQRDAIQEMEILRYLNRRGSRSYIHFREDFSERATSLLATGMYRLISSSFAANNRGIFFITPEGREYLRGQHP